MSDAEGAVAMTSGHETARTIVKQPAGASNGQNSRRTRIRRSDPVVRGAADGHVRLGQTRVHLGQDNSSTLGPRFGKDIDLQLVTIQIAGSVLPLGHVLARQDLDVAVGPAGDPQLSATGQISL